LGVSQAYVALLERGLRPVTAHLASRIVKVYGLGPTAPLKAGRSRSWNSASLAMALARLGYPGFRRVRRAGSKNPALVLSGVIAAGHVEARVIEGMPWLIAEYSDLDWDWLMREAKMRDAQNRLGFLVTLGRQIAGKRGDGAAAARLRKVEQALDRARLVREDTLCQESLSEAERRWLRRKRSREARHWNLLTDLDSGSLPYAA
jgi:hypothetical protein